MSKITDIQPQKRGKRINIFIDGKFQFAINQEAWYKSGLNKGDEISENEIGNLIYEDRTNKLFDKTLRFLSFRPRSEKEVENYLSKKLLAVSKKEAPVDENSIIKKIVDRLKKFGYLNDKEFASWWIEQRRTHRPRGIRVIRSELLAKGVDRKTVDEALNTEKTEEKREDRETELDLAFRLASKKLKRYQGLSEFEFKRKMGQYLARRGFEWEVINECLRSLEKETKSKEQIAKS